MKRKPPTGSRRSKDSRLSVLNKRLRDISSTKANQRDATEPIPAPFYADKSSTVAKKAKKVVYSRQLQPDDIFVGSYDRHGLIVPPYSPTQLYSLYESSSILSPHIDAYQRNIDGFDPIFKYIGPIGKKDSEEAKKDKKDLIDFFKHANENQSFGTIRRAMRLDYEVLGYGYIEVTRSQDGEIACMYHVPAKYIRLAKLKGEIKQQVTVYLPRKGKIKPITILKKFRRFAQVLPGATTNNIRWFKEYGDKRKMDAKTGKFESKDNKVTELASELISIKNGNDTYGLPRWVGNILGVMGVRCADYINYDLFDSQGIPPLVIMVSGGILTQDSIDTIEALLRQAKGYQNFNRLLLLEAESSSGGIDDKAVPKIAMKSLSEARAEDAMFQKYISSTEEKVRMDFRLPQIYVGRSSDYNRAVIEHSRIIAEEQVFEPERNIEDEVYNNTIMPEIGSEYWAFKSGGPPLVTGEGLLRGYDSVSKTGVFTINQSLEIVNRAMGLDFEEIKEAWADAPLAVLTRLLDRGFFADLDQLVDVLEGNATAINNPTVLLEGPAAGNDDLVDVDTKKEISAMLNSILGRAKDQLLQSKIEKAVDNAGKEEDTEEM